MDEHLSLFHKTTWGAAGLILAALIGGAGFRLRGSQLFHRLTGRGATTARIVVWATPMALIGLDGQPDFWPMVLLVLAFWLGAVFPWFQSISLGRRREVKLPLPLMVAILVPDRFEAFYEENSWRRDAVMHALRGMLWVIPPALAMGWLGHDWLPLMLAGLLCVPAYEIGWRVCPKRHAVELGEVLFGAALGAATALS